MRLTFTAFGKTHTIAYASRPKTHERIYGHTNRCTDGKYVIYLDYDNTQLDWLEQELMELQKNMNLGDFHIFQSSPGSYHAVCLDKVSLSYLLHIMANTTVDPRYIQVPSHYGKRLWTLRATGKDGHDITYLQTIKGNNIRKKSLAHTTLYHHLFGLPLDTADTDGEEKLVLSTYLVP